MISPGGLIVGGGACGARGGGAWFCQSHSMKFRPFPNIS